MPNSATKVRKRWRKSGSAGCASPASCQARSPGSASESATSQLKTAAVTKSGAARPGPTRASCGAREIAPPATTTASTPEAAAATSDHASAAPRGARTSGGGSAPRPTPVRRLPRERRHERVEPPARLLRARRRVREAGLHDPAVVVELEAQLRDRPTLLEDERRPVQERAARRGRRRRLARRFDRVLRPDLRRRARELLREPAALDRRDHLGRRGDEGHARRGTEEERRDDGAARPAGVVSDADVEPGGVVAERLDPPEASVRLGEREARRLVHERTRGVDRHGRR